MNDHSRITNFQNITKSPESLIQWACSDIYAEEYCPLKNLVDPGTLKLGVPEECIKNGNRCSKCMLEWLKQPVDDETVKRTATVQSVSEKELSTKALDSQIDNDPVLKRLEERIKNSLSVLTMVDSDYSPEAFTGRMESIRIGNTFYGADAKRVDPFHFHEEADELMLEFLRHLGYGEGCRIFEENPKWYS